MAVISSHVWSTIRGSIGGITYTTNKFHQIIARIRTAPVQPNTTLQQQFRQSFAQAQAVWRTLTGIQRQGWKDYSESCIFEGAQGNYTISGRDMFLRNIGVALYLSIRGAYTVAINYEPPVLPGFPAIGPFAARALTAPGTGFELFGINQDPFSALYYGFRSRAFDDTRQRFKGPFPGLTLESAPVVSGLGWTMPFTALNDGSTYFAVVARITHQADAPVQLSIKDYIRTAASITTIAEPSVKKNR